MCEPSTSASRQDADLAVAQAATGRACRSGRAGRRRSRPRCRGSRCWRTGGRARPPRCSAPCRAAAGWPGISLSRPILALPPAESPSTRNSSLCAMSWLSQSVSLPGSTATPEPLRFSTFWPAFWRVCAGLDGELGELLAVVDVLVQPQLERRPHEAGDQPHRVARVQPLLDLALELRVEHLGRQHEAARANTSSGSSFTPLGSSECMLDEAP